MDYKRYEPLFGSWYIDRVIGSGSFGTVYEIRRQDFSVEYRAALKVIAIPNSDEEIQRLRLDGMKKKEIQAYFREKVETITKEVELMSKLKGNSNIVSYEDHQVIQHQDGMGWDILIRMELLTPLMKSFKEHQLTRRDVIQLGIDICRALELCQKYHIIHRDIKVDNIFVSPTGDYKLGDFGIARQLNHAASELSRKGTYAYMAPEVYHGAPYGTGVDLYSLGLVLHRLLNHNRMPFMPPPPYHMTYSDRERAVARRMNGEALPAPFGVEPESRLAEIVLMACQYNPKDRYSSATQMREDLQAILYTEGERAIIYPDGRDVLNMPSSSYAVTGNQSEENTETEIMQEGVTSNTSVQAVQPTADRGIKKKHIVAASIAGAVIFAALGGGIAIHQYQQHQRAALLQAEQEKQEREQIEALRQKEQALDNAGNMAVIKSDNSLWSWGENTFGQIGNGTTQSNAIPVQVLSDVKMLALGQAHTVALKNDGSVWAWGDNSFGQLGVDGISSNPSPMRVMEDACWITAGAYHTAAVTTDGKLYVWGADMPYYDEKGGDIKQIMQDVKQAVAGRYFTAVLKADGSVWTWGINDLGQLGDGTQQSQEEPIQVLDNITQLRAGKAHILAMQQDGTVWAWGAGADGQLGTGNTSDQHSPVKVSESASAIAAAGSQSALIRLDGTLWVWGNGTLLPKQHMEGAVQVGLTAHIGAAMRSDGRLYTWGDNAALELGTADAKSRDTLEKIMDGAKLLPDAVSSLTLDEKWVVEGYETSAPYKEYERLYRNGTKTAETRYTGNVKPAEPEPEPVTTPASTGSSGGGSSSGSSKKSSSGSSSKKTSSSGKSSGSSSGGSSGGSTGGSSKGNSGQSAPSAPSTPSTSAPSAPPASTGAPEIYMGFD